MTGNSLPYNAVSAILGQVYLLKHIFPSISQYWFPFLTHTVFLFMVFCFFSYEIWFRGLEAASGVGASLLQLNSNFARQRGTWPSSGAGYSGMQAGLRAGAFLGCPHHCIPGS